MLYNIIAVIGGFIPVGLIFWYLWWIHTDSVIYTKDCFYTLAYGALFCIVVVLITDLVNLGWNKLGFHDNYPLLSAIIKDFIMLAFAEEFLKHYVLGKALKKYIGAIEPHEIIALGGIVGVGFDIVDNITSSIGADLVSIIIRGITMPHVAYGLLMGWFVAKAIKKNNKAYIAPAILLPIIIQGLYDFSLSNELKSFNVDLAMIMTILIVVFEPVLLVYMLVLIGILEKKQRLVNPVLKTKRLILRPWRESDAKDCFEHASDPDIGPIAGWPPHKDEEQSLWVIRNILMARETYAICMKSSGKLIGSIAMKFKGSTEFTDKGDECELGFWLGKKYWGKGYMTEAVKEVIRHGFEQVGVNKIWAAYYEGNEKSKHVQERCGFKFDRKIEDLPVPQMNETRVGYVNVLTKEDWQNNV